MKEKKKVAILRIRATPELRELIDETSRLLSPANPLTMTQVVKTALANLHAELATNRTSSWGLAESVPVRQQYEADIRCLGGKSNESGTRSVSPSAR